MSARARAVRPVQAQETTTTKTTAGALQTTAAALPALFLPSHARPVAPTAMMRFTEDMFEGLTPEEQDRIEDVGPDGNCFFHCIAALFHATHASLTPAFPIDPSASAEDLRNLFELYLRGCMAEYLLDDRNSYFPFVAYLQLKIKSNIEDMKDKKTKKLSKEDKSTVLNEYADYLKENDCYASEIELDLAANIFNVEIIRYRTDYGMSSNKKAIREGTFRPETTKAGEVLPVWKIVVHDEHYSYVRPTTAPEPDRLSWQAVKKYSDAMKKALEEAAVLRAEREATPAAGAA